MPNSTLSPPLEYNGQPIKAMITPDGHIYLNAEDMENALGMGFASFIEAKDGAGALSLPIEGGGEVVMISLPAFYPMAWYVGMYIGEEKAKAFDTWLIETLSPAMLALNGA